MRCVDRINIFFLWTILISFGNAESGLAMSPEDSDSSSYSSKPKNKDNRASSSRSSSLGGTTEKFLDVEITSPLYAESIDDGDFEDDLLRAANVAAEKNKKIEPESLKEKVTRLVKDDREEVESPHITPWNGIVSLKLKYANNVKPFWASGVAIDDGFILTSAHNLFDVSDDSFAHRVTVTPGRKGDEAAFPPAIVGIDKIWIYPRYFHLKQDKDEALSFNKEKIKTILSTLKIMTSTPELAEKNRLEIQRLSSEIKFIEDCSKDLENYELDDLRIKYDIALIDCSHAFKEHIDANQLFSFNVEYYPVEELQQKTLTITGFPGWAFRPIVPTIYYEITTPEHIFPDIKVERELKRLNSSIMMTSNGRLIPRSKNTIILKHLIVTTQGNSGSPIYFQKDDQMICCGVHSDSAPENYNYNRGTHLTKEIIESMQQWISSRKRLYSISDPVMLDF